MSPGHCRAGEAGGEQPHWTGGKLASLLRVRTVEQLDQRYLLVPEKVKDAYLVYLIQSFQDEHEDWSIIIFTNTCK